MNKKRKRPGAWSILIVTIGLYMSAAKLVAKKYPLLLTPLSILISFLTERYRMEIVAIEIWIKKQIKALLSLRRQHVH